MVLPSTATSSRAAHFHALLLRCVSGSKSTVFVKQRKKKARRRQEDGKKKQGNCGRLVRGYLGSVVKPNSLIALMVEYRFKMAVRSERWARNHRPFRRSSHRLSPLLNSEEQNRPHFVQLYSSVHQLIPTMVYAHLRAIVATVRL